METFIWTLSGAFFGGFVVLSNIRTTLKRFIVENQGKILVEIIDDKVYEVEIRKIK